MEDIIIQATLKIEKSLKDEEEGKIQELKLPFLSLPKEESTEILNKSINRDCEENK